MMTTKQKINSTKLLQRGFTLIEILTVLFIAGLLALPFTNMFVFGVKGTHNNTEHVIAYNLAREKIEEIKTLPFAIIQSDFDNFREVFQDRPAFDEAFYYKEQFLKHFTDIFTDRSLADSENKTSYTRLKNLYQKSYLRKLRTYPEEVRYFRRVVQVKKQVSPGTPSNAKKITVLIFDKTGKTIARLSCLIGKHK